MPPILNETNHKSLIEAAKENKLVVFAGAGISMAAGLVSWKDLIKDLIIKINKIFLLLYSHFFNGKKSPSCLSQL